MSSFFGGRSSFGGGFGGASAGGNQKTLLELVDPPPDSVSAIAWSQPAPGQRPKWKTSVMASQYPQDQRIAVASWDGSIRIYDIRFNGDNAPPVSQAAAILNIQGPCLDVALDTGMLCFTAGADGVVRMHDIATKAVKDLGKHEGPCTCLKYDSDSQLVISGGVDGFLKAFNGQGNCVHQVQLSGLLRYIDVQNSFLAALCSDNSVHVLNMQDNSTQVYRDDKITLTHLQLTSVVIIPNSDNQRDKKKQIQGLVVGAVDGRCCVFSMNAMTHNRYSTHKGLETYNFASHPPTADRKSKPDGPVFPVSSLDINHRGILLTSGGDGMIRFWDVTAKTKRADLEVPNKHPVIAASYDPYNRMICYATSYDWSDGVAGHNGSIPPKLYVQCLKSIEDKIVNG